MTPGDIIARIVDHIEKDAQFIFSREASASNRNSPDDVSSSAQGGAAVGGSGRTRKQFASYLVSVVTHSIGLRASMSPLNTSREAMLAYLMDIFGLSETQLRKILIKDHLEELKSSAEALSRTAAIAPVERHSWRPQLRLHIRPPVALQSSNNIDNILVRIYLFKSDKHENLSSATMEKAHHRGSTSGRFVNFMEKFKRSRDNSESLIRRTSEMRYELKFVTRATGNDNGPASYGLVALRKSRIIGRSKIRERDEGCKREQAYIPLTIRRHYCEPESPYILRLEFWVLKISVSGFGYLKGLVNHLLNKIPISSLCCIRGGRPVDDRPIKLNLSTSGKSLYGYTNVRFSEIPAHATRASHPIVGARGTQVDTCELTTDIRNRQLGSEIEIGKSIDSVVNHIRLYAYCVSHQLASTPVTRDTIDSCLQSSITLDNLLYLPAYAIINQHRLQGNLNRLEDQSLRRSSLMLLLRLLGDPVPSSGPLAVTATLEAHKSLLIAMIKHEYSIVDRPSEVDLCSNPTDDAQDLIVLIEREAIQNLADDCLSTSRLESWIFRNSQDSGSHVDRIMVLDCLRLMRIICDHNNNSPLANAKLSSQSLDLEERINHLMSTLIGRKLAEGLMVLVDRDTKVTSQASKSASATGAQPLGSWREFLDEIQAIENDIVLHWTEKGLDGLHIDTGKALNGMNRDSDQSREDLKNYLQNEVTRYLKS